MMTELPIPDSVLWRRFASHRDREALGLLCERHARPLYHLCRRILKDPGRAEDAVQEAFAKALSAPVEGIGDFGAWIRKVAVRESLTRLRSEQRRSGREMRMEPSQTPMTPDAAAEAMEKRGVLRRAMETLEPDLAATLHLHHLEGHSVAETAEILGLSTRAVDKRLKRGREGLWDNLARAGYMGTLAMALLELRSAGAEEAPVGLASRVADGVLARCGTAGTGMGAPASAPTRGLHPGRPSATAARYWALGAAVLGVAVVVAVLDREGTPPPPRTQVVAAAPHRPPQPAGAVQAAPSSPAPVPERPKPWALTQAGGGKVLSNNIRMKVRFTRAGMAMPPESIHSVLFFPARGLDGFEDFVHNEGRRMSAEGDRFTGTLRVTSPTLVAFNVMTNAWASWASDHAAHLADPKDWGRVAGVLDLRGYAAIGPGPDVRELEVDLSDGRDPGNAVVECLSQALPSQAAWGMVRMTPTWESPKRSMVLFHRGPDEASWGFTEWSWAPQGDMTLAPVPAGRHRMLILAEGYAPEERQVEVTGGKILDLGLVSLSPCPDEISGRVVDAEGAPVPGERILVECPRIKVGGSPLLVSHDQKTDERGEFRCRLDPWFDPVELIGYGSFPRHAFPVTLRKKSPQDPEKKE